MKPWFFVVAALVMCSCGQESKEPVTHSIDLHGSSYDSQIDNVYVCYDNLGGGSYLLTLGSAPLDFRDKASKRYFLKNPEAKITTEEIRLYFSDKDWVELHHSTSHRDNHDFVRFSLTSKEHAPVKLQVHYEDPVSSKRKIIELKLP